MNAHYPLTPPPVARRVSGGKDERANEPQSPRSRAGRPPSVLRWLVLFAVITGAFAQESPPPAEIAAAENEEAPAAPSLDQLYDAGKALFDQFAPEEIKAEYEFPTKERWDEFAAELQQALDNDDLGRLAEYLPQARTALTTLRLFPGYEDYADWLEERIDYIEAAEQTAAVAPPTPAPNPATPAPESSTPAVPAPRATPPRAAANIPYYELWLERMIERPTPAAAEKHLPTVRAAFEAEGVPAEIAWLAEAESTFNPNARSPVGAKGLFQFMPETAKSLGLSTFLPDERTHPEKSARAAARYLKALHGKFGEWPLAFAAYNAGEGRVRRLLAKHGGSTFASIASALPSETRMYVPKVCATIAVRAGVAPENLAPPKVI